jgi:hypothetical protein
MRTLQVTIPPGLTSEAVFRAVSACRRNCRALRWTLAHGDKTIGARVHLEEKLMDLAMVANVWARVGEEMRAAESAEAPDGA